MFTSQHDLQQDGQEIYNVKSDNQTGGTTAGKIQNFQFCIDKESLGIREPMGLYKANKKIGVVINPTISEQDMSFTFDEIQLDHPMPNIDMGFIFSPFEFQKYIVQATHAYEVVPEAIKDILGKILSIK